MGASDSSEFEDIFESKKRVKNPLVPIGKCDSILFSYTNLIWIFIRVFSFRVWELRSFKFPIDLSKCRKKHDQVDMDFSIFSIYGLGFVTIYIFN